MIFVGDIAHPFRQAPTWGQPSWPWLKHQAVVANLEGALVFSDEQANTKHRALFNHASILDTLISTNVRVVSLANNHIMDIPGALENTCAMLREKDIAYTGAGETLSEASSPAQIVKENKTWIFLAAGWETIQCRPAGPDSAGINPLRPEQLLAAIEFQRLHNPDAVLVVMPHWNYELELYPQPAHRQLAMAAIDAGADGVIGHHPHRVGGIEIYKGKPIAYSLGNWWMPQGVYFGGKLSFGDETLLQLALEWSPGTAVVCHWFEYRREDHQLIHISSEPLAKSARIRQLTPFDGMPHNVYRRWFQNHRIKRKALPIYHDYRHRLLNALKDYYVQKRHLAIMVLEGSGLRRLMKV